MGEVKSIGEKSSYYKNVTITDGSKDFLIYTVSVDTGVEDFKVGDTIIAYGYVKNYEGTIEMATGNGEFAYVVAVNPEIPDTPACTHKNTEIKNAKAATCGAAGYTGDTYCVDCDTKLSSGFEIQSTGDHAWGEAVIITPPTANSDGEQKYTCSVCGKEKTESVPKLDSPTDDPIDPPVDDPVNPPVDDPTDDPTDDPAEKLDTETLIIIAVTDALLKELLLKGLLYS